MIEKINSEQTPKALPSSLPSSPLEVGSSFEATYGRLKQAVEAKSDSDMAAALGIKQGSISVAKKRKQLPPNWIEKITKSYGISADWLFFGTGLAKREGSSFVAPSFENESLPPPAKAEPPPSAEDFKMSDMLTKTAEILESDTIYRTALASNINAFHQAVRSERTLARLEERMDLIEKEMEGLKRENRELKQRLEHSGQVKAVGEDG